MRDVCRRERRHGSHYTLIIGRWRDSELIQCHDKYNVMTINNDCIFVAWDTFVEMHCFMTMGKDTVQGTM